jgi:hypothetical protein
MSEVQVPNQDLGSFVRAGASVVKEQKKEVVAPPLRTPEVRGSEECIDLGLFQVSDGFLSASLEGYGTDLPAPSEMLGAV